MDCHLFFWVGVLYKVRISGIRPRLGHHEGIKKYTRIKKYTANYKIAHARKSSPLQMDAQASPVDSPAVWSRACDQAVGTHLAGRDWRRLGIKVSYSVPRTW